MNEYVSSIVYQSLVCLIYKIITMICIVLSIYMYTFIATQLNIDDDDVKSSVKKERKKERSVLCQ